MREISIEELNEYFELMKFSQSRISSNDSSQQRLNELTIEELDMIAAANRNQSFDIIMKKLGVDEDHK